MELSNGSDAGARRPPDDLGDVFQALSDPSRRMIVERLADGDASVTELAHPLDMSLPAVLQHVRVLEASGLVRTQKTGRVRMCRLEGKTLDHAESWFAERRSAWHDRLDQLGFFLETTITPSLTTTTTTEETP